MNPYIVGAFLVIAIIAAVYGAIRDARKDKKDKDIKNNN
jgi:hypothetical protein